MVKNAGVLERLCVHVRIERIIPPGYFYIKPNNKQEISIFNIPKTATSTYQQLSIF